MPGQSRPSTTAIVPTIAATSPPTKRRARRSVGSPPRRRSSSVGKVLLLVAKNGILPPVSRRHPEPRRQKAVRRKRDGPDVEEFGRAKSKENAGTPARRSARAWRVRAAWVHDPARLRGSRQPSGATYMQN